MIGFIIYPLIGFFVGSFLAKKKYLPGSQAYRNIIKWTPGDGADTVMWGLAIWPYFLYNYLWHQTFGVFVVKYVKWLMRKK